MNDSRLKQAEILIDDARCLLTDLDDEGLNLTDLVAARRLLNDALTAVQKAATRESALPGV